MQNQDNSNQEKADFHFSLNQLKKQIQKYVVIEGIARVLLVIGALFWISLGIDWLYFQSRMLELPLWFRQTFLFAAILFLAVGIFTWIFARAFNPYRPRSLALLLEKKFPELDDRLITAIEYEELGTKVESPLAQTMLTKTRRDVSNVLQSLDLRNVFNPGPLRKSVSFAAILVVSIIALAVTNRPALARWADGYLFLQDEYWDREVDLKIHVLAQPGDRKVEFVDNQYKHPKGEDITLIVQATAKNEAKLPSRIMINSKMSDGTSSRMVMTDIGDGTYRKTIPAVQKEMSLWFSGGDFINREPFQIILVDPPRLDELTLFCRYPDYTRLNISGDPAEGDPAGNKVQFRNSKTSIPVGTNFVLRASANKRLTNVDMRTDRFEISLKPDQSETQATLVIKSEEGATLKSETLSKSEFGVGISEDRMSFELDFSVVPDFNKEIAKLLDSPKWPLPLPEETKFRVYLSDEDGVISSDPIRMTIAAIRDEFPKVEIRRQGISNTITSKARIPIAGLIEDDYGIKSLNFLFSKNDPVPKTALAFKNDPEQNRKYEFGDNLEYSVERFDVTGLNLEIGNSLSLTVAAMDANFVTGFQTARGQIYQFKIVSDEELRSILYQRELTLRRRLEQVINELVKTSTDLKEQKTRYAAALELKESGNKTPDEKPMLEWDTVIRSIRDSAQRAEYSIRQNGTETASIQQAFVDIREEMINNDVASPKRLVQLNSSVIRPLNLISTERFPETDLFITDLKATHERLENPSLAIENSTSAIDEIVDMMNSILKEVLRQESLSELIERVKSIREDQEKILKKTKEEKKKRLIDLKGLGLD